jgi:hypothetical protein
MNEQAKDVAASVLGEPVRAATRCEQITQGMHIEAARRGKAMRGVAKFRRGMAKPMSVATGLSRMEKDVRGGGLPKSFLLAITDTKVAAIENKRRGGQLVPGEVVKTWGRDEITGRAGSATMVPGDDRQQLTLYLPAHDVKSRHMKAAAAELAKMGVHGRPVNFLVAKDEASQKVIELLSAEASLPTRRSSPVTAALRRDLNEASFAAEKARILGP